MLLFQDKAVQCWTLAAQAGNPDAQFILQGAQGENVTSAPQPAVIAGYLGSSDAGPNIGAKGERRSEAGHSRNQQLEGEAASAGKEFTDEDNTEPADSAPSHSHCSHLALEEHSNAPEEGVDDEEEEAMRRYPCTINFRV